MKTLVLLFNELSATSLSCYGGSVETPHFDELAAVGDVFTSCFAANGDRLTDTIVQGHRASYVQDELDITELTKVDVCEEFGSDHLLILPIRMNIAIDMADAKIKNFFEGWKDGIDPECAIVLTSQRGALSNESLETLTRSVGERRAHVPLMIHLPKQSISRRRTRLMTTQEVPQLISTLHNSIDDYARWRDGEGPSQIEYRSEKTLATRSRDWLFVQPLDPHETEAECHLYRKPEDIWEVFDVAQQYCDVIDQFRKTNELPQRLPRET